MSNSKLGFETVIPSHSLASPSTMELTTVLYERLSGYFKADVQVFWIFGIWILDLSFPSMYFAFEHLFLDSGLYVLNIRFVKN